MTHTKETLEAMSRVELETAYLATLPQWAADADRPGIGKYPTAYLIGRMLPDPKKSKRGPRMARHANDDGES